MRRSRALWEKSQKAAPAAADTPAVLLVIAALVSAFTVPLAGGKLSRLADAKLRGTPLILGALGIQILIITAMPGGAPALHKVVHIGTYVLAAAFLYLNRRIAGTMLVALGAALNVIAITANNGVMPASRSALRVAGQLSTTKEFLNSTAVAHPRMLFLGDVFAIPRSWPFANVFSIGDIVIAVGAALAIHALCGSRIVPARRPELAVSPRL